MSRAAKLSSVAVLLATIAFASACADAATGPSASPSFETTQPCKEGQGSNNRC